MTERMLKADELINILDEMEKAADGDFDVQFVLKLVRTRINNMKVFEVEINE